MATANVRSQSGASPNMGLRMSPHALNAMRNTEKVMLKYYNDMGRNKGNCTWGIGFYAHKGVCTPEELQRKSPFRQWKWNTLNGSRKRSAV